MESVPETARAATVARPAVRRVLIVGAGEMGAAAARLAHARGHRLVAVVNRPGAKIGRDIGEYAAPGTGLGVLIEDDLGEALARTRPEIAIVAVADRLDELHDIHAACLAAGVNVLCVGVETSWPHLTSPARSAELDVLARAHDVTLLGGGNQDFLMLRSGVHLAGTTARLRGVAHRRVTNAALYGRQAIEGVARVGADLVNSDGIGIYEMTATQLAADLGLRVTAREAEKRPCLAPAELQVEGHGLTIRAGEPCGILERVRLRTAEGVRIEFQAEFRVLGPGETEFSAWELDSDPAVSMRIDTGSTADTTVAQLVNRIDDVVAAPPGYLTTNDLPTIRFAGSRP